MFDHPLLAYLAPVVALVIGGLAWMARRRRIRAAAGWSEALGAAARRTGRSSPWLLGAVGLALGLAVAGPRWGAAEISTETRALSVVIGIDISRSMLAEDAQPNRLQHALREARRLIQDARGDRLALLAFAGKSYILTPLTLDDGAVSLQLDALDPDVASEGGTELAAVLRQGGEILSVANEGGAKALVLFTDGEAHDSLAGVLTAANDLRAKGITVILVAQGGVTPVRIPLRDLNGTITEYKKDATGNVVFTQRHDEILRALADAAEGVLVPADAPDQAGAIWKTLAGLDRAAASGRRTQDAVPRAWLFALAAGLLLLIHAATRRSAALVAILLAVGLSSASAQRPSTGDRRLARGDSARAAKAFLEEARARTLADTSWYNAGTMALATSAYDSARVAFAGALNSLDPGLRFRTLYNLGLAALLQSRQDTSRRAALEDEAASRFREALLLDPKSADAKWNLELVQHQPPPSPPQGGGGKSQRPQGGGSRPEPPSGGGQRGMSRSEAEQILSSVERFERAVRADQLRRRRVAHSATDKDW